MFLIINTAGQKNYLALTNTNRIIKKIAWPTHNHQSQVILPQIDRLMRQKKISLKNIQAILVYQGPGSYTGLRVGISVANALAFSLDIPVIGIRSKEINFSTINKNLKLNLPAGEAGIKNCLIPYYSN